MMTGMTNKRGSQLTTLGGAGDTSNSGYQQRDSSPLRMRQHTGGVKLDISAENNGPEA